MSKTKDIDNIPIKHGPHKGKTPEEVADIAPRYLVERPSMCSRGLFLACQSAIEEADDDEAPDSPW